MKTIRMRAEVRRALLALLALAVFWACGAAAETVRGDLTGRFEEEPVLERDGRLYRYRRGLTTILLVGVDTTQEEEALAEGARSGGQSDFLMLLVLDNRRETITPIQIDRDTMAEITVLGVLGDAAGTLTTQLCLQHGFGDGGEESCELTREAVSALMLGVEIDYYVAVNMDGISMLNDLVGGVTVTVSDDLSALDAAMVPGATLTLNGEQAETFVRARRSVGDGTNASRMARQRVYLSALAEQILACMDADGGFIGDVFDEMQPVMVTDMKRGTMINVAWRARDYAREEVCALEGEHVVGADGHMEFYADADALEALVARVFYEEAAD